MKLTIFAAVEGIDGKCYVRPSRRATKSWRGADVPRPKVGAFRIRLFVVPARLAEGRVRRADKSALSDAGADEGDGACHSM